MRGFYLIVLSAIATANGWGFPFQAREGGEGERKAYPRMVSPVDFGARPDDGRPDDVAFQRAVDALGPGRIGGRTMVGMLLIPPGTFEFAAPLIIDREDTIIRGAEEGLTVLTAADDSNTPLMMIGIRREFRNEKKLKIDRANWVDSFGRLDESAAPRRGMLWGVRPKNAVVTFWDGSLAHASTDGYESLRQLTVEWAIEPARGDTLGPGSCLGIAEHTYPLPWMVLCNEGETTTVLFRTSEQVDSLQENWAFSFPGTGKKPRGVRRRAFTIDLAKGKVSAWADGVQVACSEVTAQSTYGVKSKRGPFKPGLKFLRNELAPFAIGGATAEANIKGYLSRAESDWIFHGVRVSSAPVYADDRPGSRQRRLDGRPINDANSYFSAEPSTLGFLEQNVNPIGPHGAFLVRFRDAGGSGDAGVNYGIMLAENTQGGGISNLSHPVVKNLTFERKTGFGTSLVLGPTFDLKIEHVNVVGGWHGIGNYQMGQSWTTRLDDIKCEFCADAGFSLLGHILYARNLEVVYPGTTAIRVQSSQSVFENIFFGVGPPRSECLVRMHKGYNGNVTVFRNVNFDGEGTVNPSIAGYLIDNNALNGPMQIDIEKFGWGQMGPNAVFVKLRTETADNQTKPARCTVRDGVLTVKNLRAIFDVSGDRWTYQAENLLFDGDPPALATAESSPSRPMPPPTSRPIRSPRGQGIPKKETSPNPNRLKK